MKSKKQASLWLVAALLVLSLALAACGDATGTPASTTNATTVAVATTTPDAVATTNPAVSATTAAADSTTAAATTAPIASTTPGATAAAGKAKKAGGTAMVQTPDNSVKTLLNDVKSNDPKKDAVNHLLTANLKASLKGSKGAAGLDKLVGVTDGTNIDTISVASPTINGNNATVTATLKLKDGSTVTDNMTLVKNTLTSKKGQSSTLWQLDAISQAK